VRFTWATVVLLICNTVVLLYSNTFHTEVVFPSFLICGSIESIASVLLMCDYVRTVRSSHLMWTKHKGLGRQCADIASQRQLSSK